MHTRLLVASPGLGSSGIAAYLRSYRIPEPGVPPGGSAAGLSLTLLHKSGTISGLISLICQQLAMLLFRLSWCMRTHLNQSHRQ